MKHHINIEKGVLKYMRTMPELKEDDHIYMPSLRAYEEALTQAKADSVEIAPESIDKIMVLEYGPIGMHTLKEGIYEITTNGVFEVRNEMRHSEDEEWIPETWSNYPYFKRQLAYYKEEAKQWEWSIVDLVNCARELMIAVSFLPSVDTRTAKANAAMAFFLRDYDTHGGRKEEAKPEQPEAESQEKYIKWLIEKRNQEYGFAKNVESNGGNPSHHIGAAQAFFQALNEYQKFTITRNKHNL
jgi:hypothetical protein